MSFYRVELNGTNILMSVEGVKKNLGFIIVRIVESNTATLAGELAIREVQEMQEYKETVLDQSLKEPILKVREVEQIADTEVDEYSNTGFIFYDEDSEGKRNVSH